MSNYFQISQDYYESNANCVFTYYLLFKINSKLR